MQVKRRHGDVSSGKGYWNVILWKELELKQNQ